MTPRKIQYDALLIVADSEIDANLLYATHFFVPDPVIYFQIKKKSYLVLSDLEIDRAKKNASVDTVLSYSQITKALKREGANKTGIVEIIDHLFRKRKISSILVPVNFPVGLADGLRKKRYKVYVKEGPLFESRQFKTKQEIKSIEKSLRAAEAGMAAGINLVKKSAIGKDGYLYINKKKVTSEIVKGEVNSTILKMGYLPSHTIISCGNQCCDPHNEGSGPLRANSSIIFDIFPRSQKTGYFGDMSRTIVKGKASSRLKKAYKAVVEGQKIAFRKIKDGVNGKDIHNEIQEYFEQSGFPTGKVKNRMEGFFHGTGHGLGLEVHEYPRISTAPCILKAGHVVTVEPGLYYTGMGGIRIEDVVLVTKTGVKNLTRFPRFLEIP